MSRSDKVLAGLSAQQAEGTLCDIELQAEDQTIPAHKAVLAASTPYFEAMFTGRFEETNARVVEVKGVTFVGLQKVVEFIYTNKVKISAKNIEDILPAAHLLQMVEIVEECKGWMSQKITKNNCFDFLRLAEKYSIETVETAITEFVLKNFVAVSKTKGFTKISQQALCRYISSDTLKTGMDELAVYQAAKTWINKNKIEDSVTIFDIMKNVRFALIPLDPLSMKVSVDDIIDDHKECRRLVGEAMKYHGDVYKQPFYDVDLNKPRGKNGLLVIPNIKRAGGSFTTPDNGHIDFLSFPTFERTGQSYSLNMCIVDDSMSAVQMNNFMFLFGSKCDGYQNFTMRYDASNHIWIDLAAVPREATVGSSVACSEDKKKVFLIGGMSVNADSKWKLEKTKIISSTYMYDVVKNSWSQCNDLPESLLYSGAATLNDHVFVTGGYSADATTCTDSVYAYDIKAKLWLHKAKMNHKRSRHTLDAIDGKLYAIGGKIIGAGLVPFLEIYDSLSNQWTDVSLDDQYVMCGASSLVYDNQIYIIGGVNARQIAVYDVDSSEITILDEELPSESYRNVSAFLTIPKLL